MKNIVSYAFVAAFLLLAGCKKAAEYRDVVYFTGTEESPTARFTIEGPDQMGISVTASNKMEHDVVVGVAEKPDLLDAYNQKMGKQYSRLPADSYSLSANEVAIEAGSHVSNPINFQIKSIDNFDEGVTYCLPVSISTVGQGLEVLEASRTIYIVVSRTIITQAVDLAGNNYFSVPSFMGNPDLAALPELTLECRVLVNRFQTANPFISSLIGIEERFLIRFGDVSIPNNYLQLAGGQVTGAGKYQLATREGYSTGVWYHVAAVYNGSTMALYVDGRQVAYTDAAKGTIDLSWDYMDGFHIGFSERGRLLNGYVSEARVWKKALNGNQLQENLCYVNPTTDGLVAYWRLNGADENGNVTDLTGNGHTAIAARPAIQWVDGVRCP